MLEMYAVTLDNRPFAMDAMSHVFYCDTLTEAQAIAQEMADEDESGNHALIMKIVDSVQPEPRKIDPAALRGLVPGRDFPATLNLPARG